MAVISKHPVEKFLQILHIPWFASSHLIDLAPNLFQFRLVAERHETATAGATFGTN